MTALDKPNTAEPTASQNTWLDAARRELHDATPDVAGLRSLTDKALTGDNLLYAGAAVVVAGSAALIAARWEPIAAAAKAIGDMLGSRTAATAVTGAGAALGDARGGAAAYSGLAGSEPAMAQWAGESLAMPDLAAGRTARFWMPGGQTAVPELGSAQRFALDQPQAPSLLRDYGSTRGTLPDAYRLYDQIHADGYIKPLLAGRTADLVSALSPIVSRTGMESSMGFGTTLNDMRLAVNPILRSEGIGDIVSANVRYQAGYAGTQLQGGIAINNTLMRSVFQFPNAAELPYDKARLIGVFAHEAVHTEEESEILWRLADRIGLPATPSDGQLIDLMKLHPDNARLAGTDWWNMDFARSVMNARNGVAMSVPRGARADMLLDAFTNDPDKGYFFRRYEAEALGVERDVSNHYLNVNYGPQAVRHYNSLFADQTPGVRRFLSG